MKRLIKEYLIENWSLKATAVLLALILWFFVKGEPGPIRVVAVPLEVQVPASMEITNERPNTVEVTMRGAAFSNVWFGQPLPSCIIDLQEAKEGEHVAAIRPDNIKIPAGSGIEVLQVNPTRITLVLERTISKEVPIVVPVLEEPPRGLEIYSKSVIPPSVTISGPRSRIEPVDEISTEAVSLGGQEESASFFLRLDFKDNTLRSSVADPVQVNIQIGPHRRLFTIARVPVIPDDAAYDITPEQISVQLLAPIDTGNAITADDLNAVVETKNLNVSKLPTKVKPVVALKTKDSKVAIRNTQPSELVVKKSDPKSTK